MQKDIQITGIIHLIGKTENIGLNNFKKRLLVVETIEEFPQKIPIDFVKEKTILLDYFKYGEKVCVSINLRGNESNGRWFLQAQGWKISHSAI